MRRIVAHIAALVVALTLVGCGSRGRIIPKSEMVYIYADMYLADQWLSSRYDEYQKADSLLFYEPIFNRYGYTTEDFRASVYYYLSDPRRFARITQKTASRLEYLTKRLEAYAEIYRGEQVLSFKYKLTDTLVLYYSEDFMTHCMEYPLTMQLDSVGRYFPERPWVVVPSDVQTEEEILDEAGGTPQDASQVASHETIQEAVTKSDETHHIMRHDPRGRVKTMRDATQMEKVELTF